MESRINKLLPLIKEKNAEAFFSFFTPNVRYLTGFSGSNGLVYLAPGKKLFLTDKRYEEQVKKEVQDYEIIVPESTKPLVESLFTVLGDAAKTFPIGFESDHVSYAVFQKIRETLGTDNLVPISGLIESLRVCKSDEEIARIQEASDILDRTFSQIIEFIRPGMMEIEVGAQIDFLIKKNGGSKPAFDTIVASGKNGALPHARPTQKIIEKGDLVTLDMGCYYKGYASDMTRTISIGPATERQKEVYHTVLEAQLRATEFLGPNKSMKEMDACARNYITEKGYGDYFKHGLGHGVGLDVHENPRVNKEAEKNFAVGMTLTNEPGIYIADWGGVRIEDVLLVTETGHRVLHHSTKNLIELT